MKPLVSILIPAFNSEKWIADTLRSAIAQTYPWKEIIVVDDGSTDRTLAIARRFESATVRVMTQKNQGGPVARNTAFSSCQGDYIQYLDHDDLLAPDKIEKQIAVTNHCESKRTLFSSKWASFMYRPSRAVFMPTALWCDLSPSEFLLRKMEQNLFMMTSAWLVSRELSEAAGPWNSMMLTDDDGEYFCRVLLACDGIRFVPEAKSYWRRSGTIQASYIGNSDRKIESLLLALKLHIQYLRSLEESDRVRRACVTYLQNSFQVFYPERLDLIEELKTLASELQGELKEPHLGWKYAWIKTLFGWEIAKRAQNRFPQLKTSCIMGYDKLMHSVETGRNAVHEI
jgi:glycosyltransferase involved in cell wall biosynthesis